MNDKENHTLLQSFSSVDLYKTKVTYADLQIQAMMFDMDIDIETWSLVPKQKKINKPWLDRWMNKFHEADNLPEDPEQNLEEDI